jgi:hypothetical protein
MLTLRFSLALLAAAGFAACARSPAGFGGARLNATEQMMWSTYPLATRKGAATGFVINRRDPGAPGGVAPVVVTSMHVLKTAGRGPLAIAVRLPGSGTEPEIAVIRMQPARGKDQFYVRHPQHDVAAFEMHLPAQLTGLVTMPSFLNERALAGGDKAPRAGAEVFFLGFPDVMPGTAGAFPVLRSGRIASYPVSARPASGYFLINADVYPGDSGAPVFAAGRGGRPELIGMIVRRVGADDRAFSHLAIAVGTGAIRETLEMLSGKARSDR